MEVITHHDDGDSDHADIDGGVVVMINDGGGGDYNDCVMMMITQH